MRWLYHHARAEDAVARRKLDPADGLCPIEELAGKAVSMGPIGTWR
ncbi:MAG: hypothetical protein V4472_10525 [Pseudomonadota bacterium]